MTQETKRSTFTIRPAIAEDAATVLRFIQQLARYEKLEHVCVATEDALRSSVFAPNSSVHVALMEERASLSTQATNGDPLMPPGSSQAEIEVVGFALYFYNYSTFLARRGLYLEDLFVLPEHRGKGYGKAMMIHLARIAVNEGCGRFEWSVLDWNTPSIQFYRSIGAVGMDEWTVQRVTGDALLRLAE